MFGIVCARQRSSDARLTFRMGQMSTELKSAKIGINPSSQVCLRLWFPFTAFAANLTLAPSFSERIWHRLWKAKFFPVRTVGDQCWSRFLRQQRQQCLLWHQQQALCAPLPRSIRTLQGMITMVSGCCSRGP